MTPNQRCKRRTKEEREPRNCELSYHKIPSTHPNFYEKWGKLVLVSTCYVQLLKTKMAANEERGKGTLPCLFKKNVGGDLYRSSSLKPGNDYPESLQNRSSMALATAGNRWLSNARKSVVKVPIIDAN